MRKLLLILPCIALMSMNASYALGGIKLVQFGVKAGITSQNIELVKNSYEPYTLSTTDRMGFQIGLMSRVNLALFHIQPELLYSMNRYRLYTNGENGKSGSTVKLNTVEVPVLFGLKMLMFRLNAGPVFNIATKTNVSSSGTPPRNVMITKPAISYMLGLGVDIAKLNFDIRYNGQLARPDQSIQIGDLQSKEFKTRLRTWMFSVGYMF